MKKPGTWHTGPSQSAPLNVTGRSRPIPGDHCCLSDSSGLYSFPANDLEWSKGYRLLYSMYNELTLNPRALAKTKDIGERHEGKPRGIPGREGSLGCHEGRTHCSSLSPPQPPSSQCPFLAQEGYGGREGCPDNPQSNVTWMSTICRGIELYYVTIPDSHSASQVRGGEHWCRGPRPLQTLLAEEKGFCS